MRRLDAPSPFLGSAFGAALAAAACVAGFGTWSATAFIAGVFDGQAALGPHWLSIGTTPIYPPWSIFDWTPRFADTFPKPFAIARLIVFASLALAGLILVLGLKRKPIVSPFGQAAWGGFKDAEAAGLLASSGCVLGKLDGETLCFAGHEHQLLIGASRSGKGRGHVVPTLLTWPGSTLVMDVKGELADGDQRHGFPGTAGFRETLGPVLRFAPTRSDTSCFNPLFEVRRGANEIRDVQNIIEIIVDPAGDGRHNDFWDKSARHVLLGVILHVLYAEPTNRKSLAVVREKLRDLRATFEVARRTLHRVNPITGVPEVHPEVTHAAESFLAGEERLQSGIKATAESFFGLFADPMVEAATARSDFRIADLMCGDKPVSLYLQPPPSDAARLMPLMRLMLNQIARGLMENQVHASDGRTKQHILLLCLDEFPQLGRMPFFETAMGAMAGYGLKAYLVCQSLNHITRAYGRDNVILDNCHVVTAFSAADMETARRIADMAGEAYEMRPQESEQRPRSLLGGKKGSITWREERRSLLSPGDVRQLGRNEQLVFMAGVKPLRTEKLRFDQESLLAKRLRRSSNQRVTLSTSEHVGDWSDQKALGHLSPDPPARRGARIEAKDRQRAPAPVASPQGDLFAAAGTLAPEPATSDTTPPTDPGALPPPNPHPSISERASAGLRNSPHPLETHADAPPRRAVRRTGV